MLKPQDCIILLKILAHPGSAWSQRQLAHELCISLSEVNAGIKRLGESGLMRRDKQGKLFPNLGAAKEFLIYGIKFIFPAKLGEFTKGVPTAYAAPLFQGKVVIGKDPIPVWPDALGKKRGVAFAPIHPSVPKSIRENPDLPYYELLVLIDAIRLGRACERDIASRLLKQRLDYAEKR